MVASHRSPWLLWATVSTLLAASMSAQEPPPRQNVIEAARELPLRTGRVDPPIVLGFRDGTATVLVEIAAGRATATIDGEALPADRLVRWRDHWFVLDTNGGVAAHLSVDGAHGHVRTHSDRFRVTLGLVVNGPDRSKLLLYDLAPRSALEILSLRADGPAERAGLQIGDVLIEIDGRKPVTRTAIREAIGAHEVGDSIPVAFLRAGKRLEASIPLSRDYAAYVEADRPTAPIDSPVGGGVLRGSAGEVVLAPPRDDLEDRVAALDRRMARIEALLERLVGDRRPSDDAGKQGR